MKTFALLLISILLVLKVSARPDFPAPKVLPFGNRPAGIIEGKLYDKETREPLAYVTVTVRDSSEKVISGGISNEKGFFLLDSIASGKLTISFQYMGYQKLTLALQLKSSGKLNLGDLFLQPDAAQLKEVSVIAEKPGISLKLDKKVFEVGKDILSQNGSVNDILNGVPSVAVSPSGAISLRGNSSVLVLINGRRSGLTQSSALDQIPADQIEKVEVITNPSSRYDASGSAGIINIILKKNKKSGFNGQLRVVGGIPNDNRVNPSINYKSDKINLFSTFGLRLSDYVGLYRTKQQTTANGIPTFLDQVQHEDRHDDGKLLYFGADYFINEKSTITLAFLKNATHDHDKTNLNYQYSGKPGSTDSTVIRNGESWERRNYNQLEFNYTRNFTQPAKKLTVDLQYDFWNSDKDWNLFTQKTFPQWQQLPGIRTSSIGSSKDFLLQTDFVQPLNGTSTLEMGIKAENRKVISDFRAEEMQGNDWVLYHEIDNKLTYTELIGSAYLQFGSKIGKFSYLLGIRTELTRVDIEDRISIYQNKKNYDKLFPTFNTSYRFSSGAALQFNYSKRINRPSLSSLYPFNELTDFNAQYMGNPDLNPSYANVFELGFLKNWSKFTFNPALYYQHHAGLIQDYTYRDEDGLFITTPINIRQEIRKGIELSLLASPIKGLQLNGEFNYYKFNQEGNYQGKDLNFSGNSLTARLSAQVKLPAAISFQGRYNLTGAKSNAQSRTAAVNSADFALSKGFLKDKATVAADVSNAFNSRKFQTRTTGSDYVFEQISNPNAARYRISLVYRFNLKDTQAIRQAKGTNRN